MHLCVILFLLCLVLIFHNPHHKIKQFASFISLSTHTCKFTQNIVTYQHKKCKKSLPEGCSSEPRFGGQGELVLEALLNCIFGAEQPPSCRGRTAEPVCGGLKVLHCTRQFPNCQPFTGFLMCICMCANSASKSRMKVVRSQRQRRLFMCHLSINMSVYVLSIQVIFPKDSTQSATKPKSFAMRPTLCFIRKITQHYETFSEKCECTQTVRCFDLRPMSSSSQGRC